MVKRLFCVLMSLLIFLGIFSACGKQQAPKELTVNFPTSAEELPEIGEFVADTKINYFFEDGPHDEFTPRDDYGRLVCYYPDLQRERSPLWSEDPDAKTEYRYNNYFTSCGLMTADGRVVTSDIWSSPYIYEFSPGQGIISLYGNSNEDYYKTIISLDGSWSIDADDVFPLFEHGVPYFMIRNDDDRYIYDLDGKKLLDISPYLHGDGSYYDSKSVLVAKDDLLILNEFINNDREGVTALNLNGDVLYTITVDWYGEYGYAGYAPGMYFEDREALGDRVLAFNVYEPVEPYDLVTKLYTIDGKSISKHTYVYAGYDAHFDVIAAKRRSGTGYAVDYFNGDGEPLSIENTWNAVSFELMDEFDEEFIDGNDCILFRNENRDGYLNIYGKPLTFNLPDGQSAAHVWEIDEYEESTYVRVLTSDKKAYICNVDGEMLFEIAYPYHSRDGYYGYDIERDGDHICSVDDEGIIHVYSISERAEILSLPNPFVGILRSSDIYLKDQYIAISEDSNNMTHYSLYQIPSGRLIARDLLTVRVESDYAAAASASHTSVISPEGETILRQRLDYSD